MSLRTFICKSAGYVSVISLTALFSFFALEIDIDTPVVSSKIFTPASLALYAILATQRLTWLQSIC